MKRNQALNILLVIDSLGAGGAQRQMVWLATGLMMRGHKVSLLLYYPQIDHFREEIEQLDIAIIESAKRFRWDWRPSAEIRRRVESEDIDVVISFLDTPNVYAVLGRLLSADTRLVVSERKMFVDGKLGVLQWLRYQGYRCADAVTSNSYHQSARLARYFPWMREKLHTIWNGLDLEVYSPKTGDESSDRSSLCLLAVATIVEWKNARNLIKGVHLARKQGAELSVHWAGRVLPTEKSRKELDACNRLVSDYGLEDAWTWLGAVKGMQDVYPGYDGLVHPSLIEGLPNAVCEALACGLPILASEVCDHPRLVDHGENGYLFDPADPESIADCLLRFSATPAEQRRAMGLASRRFAEIHLGANRLVDEYEALALNLVAPTGSPDSKLRSRYQA